ncbi:hypothetical protein Tco_1580229 [Tanacetum coccineum]
METIHVTFDELTEQMAPVQSSPGPAPNLLTPGPISSGLVPGIRQNPIPNVAQDPVIPTGSSVSMAIDLDAPSGMLQILWGVVNRAHIDYAERMWEEFTQSIHTFIEDKRKLAQHTLGKKKATLILILSIRFTKLIIFHLQRLHNFHPRPKSPLPKPAKPTKQAKPKATEQPTISKTKAKKSKPAPAKPKEKKRKPVSESSEAQPLAKHAKAGKVVKKRTVKSSKQLLNPALKTQRRQYCKRETDAGKIQPLPEVPGKGKEKVGEEQAAQVLLHLQTTKKKSPNQRAKSLPLYMLNVDYLAVTWSLMKKCLQ